MSTIPESVVSNSAYQLLNVLEAAKKIYLQAEGEAAEGEPVERSICASLGPS